MKTFTVLFFAQLKTQTGTDHFQMDGQDNLRVADLRRELALRFPSAAVTLSRALVSINREFAFDDDLLPENAEIAIFPPVSGGSEFPTILKVVYEPLDFDDLIRQISLETTGAVCVFSGLVRGKTQRDGAHETAALEYEAYIPMAEAKMAQVAAEIRARWPAVEGIVIVQRIGRLKAGTQTVLIACSAGHRDTGVFEAARYGIDRLKEIVPIWKKEIGTDGEEWIEGKYHPKRGD